MGSRRCGDGVLSTQLIFPTPVLRHMVQRRRLDHLCSELPSALHWNHQQLKVLAHAKAPQAWQPDAAQALIAAGFAVSAVGQSQQVALPFVFVTAVNLELTYGCNLACTHCLQGAMRPKGSDVRWLKLDLIRTLLHDAEWLGLLGLGLNLTGGKCVPRRVHCWMFWQRPNSAGFEPGSTPMRGGAMAGRCRSGGSFLSAMWM